MQRLWGIDVLGAEDHDMLITSLKRHFPARFPEWLNSGILFTWGAYVTLHPELFTQPGTRQLWSGMAQMTWGTGLPPAELWGLVAVTVGLLRACALFINGAYTRTPLIRVVASFISAFIWTQVVVGSMQTGIPNTGLVVYSWLVVADLVSAYRAAADIIYAEKQRSESRTEIGGGRSNKRSLA